MVIAAALGLLMQTPLLVALPQFAFLPDKPIKQHYIDFKVKNTYTFDRTGTIQIFSWKGDWGEAKNRARKELSARFREVKELPGDSAMLYYFGGADVRFAWGYGDTVGLYRDFRATPQRIRNLFSDSWHLKGRETKGWLTALVYLDDDRPGSLCSCKLVTWSPDLFTKNPHVQTTSRTPGKP